MLKAMLSQPMRGLSDEAIKATKEKAVEKLQSLGYEVVNTLFEDFPNGEEKHIPIAFLSKSIYSMSMVDAVYFCKGWEEARGCVIEHEVAAAYGVEIIEEE